MINIYDDVLSRDALNNISNYAKTANYTCGWKADPKLEEDYGHWNHMFISSKEKSLITDLSSDQAFMQSEAFPIWKQLSLKFGKCQLIRSYLNLYTHGTEGYVHRDDSEVLDIIRSSEYKYQQQTFLVYLNEEWDVNWAGETIFFDDNDNIINGVLPKYGRVVIFDGAIKHVARSISRICPEKRRVLAFKTIKKLVNSDAAIKYFARMSDGVAHSKDSYFSHCYNVYRILKMQGMNEEVCLAGLYHSVYSTEYFNNPVVVDREEIINNIGSYAESLVEKFCNLKDRINDIANNISNFDDVDHYNLSCIEHANLTEQRDRIGLSSSTMQALQQIEQNIGNYRR